MHFRGKGLFWKTMSTAVFPQLAFEKSKNLLNKQKHQKIGMPSRRIPTKSHRWYEKQEKREENFPLKAEELEKVGKRRGNLPTESHRWYEKQEKGEEIYLLKS